MCYTAERDFDVTATTIRLAENCHTDAMPLVRELFFKNAEFDTSSAAFALACLVLTRQYVGEQAEYESMVLGIETMHAIAVMFPWLVNVQPIDAMNRVHALGELDIACGPARLAPLAVAASGHVPLITLDWSGDIVDQPSRSSAGFRLGRYFTNAGLITDDVSVSIAIALMHGGTALRNIYVRLPLEQPPQPYLALKAGLETIGIALNFVESDGRR